ncbi:hypothetical protein C4D60_Mb09t17840 [Musa balbisiana]|uniref:Uncharacterized protein n=1 Tax=Musa balbisiana TaxID=52838 RepID=A0A4S8IHA2_MUSBA|nr:hypothetical protein C4D60_Mb09t17840 [Musa balbisiana]
MDAICVVREAYSPSSADNKSKEMCALCMPFPLQNHHGYSTLQPRWCVPNPPDSTHSEERLETTEQMADSHDVGEQKQGAKVLSSASH